MTIVLAKYAASQAKQKINAVQKEIQAKKKVCRWWKDARWLREG